jgi:hypothetical protein
MLAITAAAIVGGFAGLVAGLVVGALVPDTVIPAGTLGWPGLVAGAVGVGWLVARLVPRRQPPPSSSSSTAGS